MGIFEGKELSLFSWCTASLYIYYFSTVVDFSSEEYSGSIGHRNSWYQQRNLSVYRPDYLFQTVISVLGGHPSIRHCAKDLQDGLQIMALGNGPKQDCACLRISLFPLVGFVEFSIWQTTLPSL